MTDWEQVASLECVSGVLPHENSVHLYFTNGKTTQSELEMINNLVDGDVGDIISRLDGELFVKVEKNG
jgi:hypothetical protein